MDEIIKSLFESILPDSTTCSESSSSLTLKVLQEAIELLRPEIKIFFMKIPMDKIFSGSLIDRLLNCKEDQQGFIVPEHRRQDLDEYKAYFEECTPSMIQFPISYELKFK